jgi:aminomethyltransferase
MGEPAKQIHYERTSLYEFHVSHGGKMVPFAGYEMPVQYTDGIVKEHLKVRNYAGIFDVSHMGQFSIHLDEKEYSKLETIIPIDFSTLQFNQSKYTVLLNAKGGIDDDLIVTKVKEGINIVLNAACKQNDVKRITEIIGSKNTLLHKDLSLIAFQGPKAVSVLAKIIPGVETLSFMNGNTFIYEGENIYITRSGYTGEDGFEISISNSKAEDFCKLLLNDSEVGLIGLGARDSLRLEAGLCLYGHDLNTNTNPIEANLGWAMSKKNKTEGNFLGSKIILNEMKNGSKKRRVGIKPEKIIAREGAKIFKDQKEIGVVTSGGFGPSVNGPIAMGYIVNEFSKEDTEIELEVRGKRYPGKVTALPFYKKNYVK